MTERTPSESPVAGPESPRPKTADMAATISQVTLSIETSLSGSPPKPPQPPASNASEPAVPKSFGRYKIEKELGKGAMGVVYLAEDSQLGRKVALKIPKKSALEDPESLERFYREARTTSRLRHANICPVYDVGAIDGVHYLTMEFIPGKPISSFLGTSKLPAAKQLALLIRKIALGLEHAHQQGVVHRDLKPSNVMLDNRNEPIVMDFGLACQLNTAKNARLTQSGAILGTPAYMSPEQVRGEVHEIGPKSDIYALGVMLYQFLTGELPFSGPIMMVFAQILTEKPKRPSEFRSNIDPVLEAICCKMMAKNANDRYGSMKDVAAALTEYIKTGAVAGLDVVPRSEPQATPAPTPTDMPDFDFNSLPALPEMPIGSSILVSRAMGATKPKSKDQSKRSAEKSWKPLSVIGIAGVALSVLFAVVYVQLGSATVKLEVLDPSLKVRFGKDELTIKNGGKPIKVSPGKQSLLVSRDGFQTETKEFTLSRGETKQLVVTLVEGNVQLLTNAEYQTLPKPEPAAVPKLPKETPETVLGSNDINPGDALPVDRWIDVLSMVKLPEHAYMGKWERNEHSLVCEPGNVSRYSIPVALQGSYELNWEFTRKTGSDAVLVQLPIGTRRCALCLSGADGLGHSLFLIDGRLWDQNSAVAKGGSFRPGTLKNGKKHQVQMQVIQNGADVLITASLDQQQIIHWSGKMSLLSVFSDHMVPNPQSLGVLANRSIAETHKLELRLMSGGQAYRMGSDWKTPLIGVADVPPAEIADKCITWKQRKYFISDKPMTVPQAQQLATDLHGRLLTFSSKEEEDFWLNGKWNRLWMAGWHGVDGIWRDERNRPLRYHGTWCKTEPSKGFGEQHLLLRLDGDWRGLHDCHPADLHFACIEWGEEYASTDTDLSGPSPDRAAAQAMLSLGAFLTIRTNGVSRAIKPGDPLPIEDFQLTFVNLNGKPALTNQQLEPLRGLLNLQVLYLHDAKGIADAGINWLQEMNTLTAIDLAGTSVSDAGVAYLKKFKGLQVINLEGVPVTDTGLANFEGLADLRFLSLGYARITDDGLVYLKQSRRLDYLNIGEIGLTDECLQHLEGISELQYLNLNGNRITNEGLNRLMHLTKLKTLGLAKTRVTDAGLKQLSALQGLEDLSLDLVPVSDAGLANLVPLANLRALTLINARITDDGMAHLKGSKKLNKLCLISTGISDAGLVHLKELHQLTELDLTNTKVTLAGVEDFRKTLPNCKVIGPKAAN